MANQTRANILMNPQKCRAFVTSDSYEIIAFDENLSPIILSAAGNNGSIPILDSPPIASEGICKRWIKTGDYETVRLVFPDNTNKNRCIPFSYADLESGGGTGGPEGLSSFTYRQILGDILMEV
jgi:hypothetical protein